MDLKQQVQNVAAQGRYGDSMLLHVNPAEVRGLAQAVPLTINPQTGQPEAFLPFLAPLLGSTLASSLAASGVLGATLAASPALAAGLGAGLATYAQTGGSGSKALLSGLTAGFGTNAANTAAQAANIGQQTTANIAAGMAPDAASAAAQTAAAAAPRAATGPLTALKDTFAGGFDEGATALTQGLMSPSGAVAVGTAGTRGIMESQELFEEMLARNAREQEEERQRIFAENPEMVPIATGGVTKMQDGGEVQREDYDLPDNFNAYQFNPYTGMYDGGTNYGSAGNYGPNLGSFTGQGYVQAREATRIDPYFMAGFQPEATYFENLNPSAGAITSGTTTSQTRMNDKRMPPLGGRDQRMFNPTQTVGYQSFYGDQAKDIIPQVVDPYAPVEFERPPPPMLRQPMPYPIALGDVETPTPIIEPVQPTTPTTPTDPTTPVDDIYTPTPKTKADTVEPIVDTSEFVSPDLTILDELKDLDIPINVSEQVNIPEIDLSNLNIPTDLPQLDITDTDAAQQETFMASPSVVVFGPDGKMYGSPSAAIAAGVTDYTMTPPGAIPFPNLGGGEENPIIPPIILGETPYPDRRIGGGVVDYPRDASVGFERMSDGKETKSNLKSIPEDNKGLAKLPEDVRNKMGYMQAGGNTEIMQDPLTSRLVQFLMGEIQDDTIVGEFVNKYGNEIFMQIREQVLQQIVPLSQTQGQINGNAAGGMADDIYGKIGATQGVAVSQDEYIIPADVMSMLGDGSSDAGAKKLDQMLDRVRMTKTGTTKQAKEIDDSKVMPA